MEHPSYVRLREMARHTDTTTEDGLKDFIAICWALDHILQFEQGMSILQSSAKSVASNLPATAVCGGGGKTFTEER